MFRNFIALVFLVGSLIAAFDVPTTTAQSDASLASVRAADQASKTPDGKLGQMTAAEHVRRARIYHTNRAFPEARLHWQAILEQYPSDPAVAMALFGMGRSLFQEKSYAQALPYLDQVGKRFPDRVEGRDGVYFEASTLLRMGRSEESARKYEAYVNQFPSGERIEAAYLNVIDTWREADRPAEAIRWIGIVRQRFPRTDSEANAVFARLRLDLSLHDWNHAIVTADELKGLPFPKGTMTNYSEVAFLKGWAQEKSGRKTDAINTYFGIADTGSSYSGALATQRLQAIAADSRQADLQDRISRARSAVINSASQYPAPFRDDILRSAKPRKLDPRFVLAIMRIESAFKPNSKSPAAARGLLQLTVDTALKYTPQVGIRNLSDDDLYKPSVSILIGSEYLSELFDLFPHLPEAVAASYNGGEDNAARWLKRSKADEPPLFAAEVGFSETKEYVRQVLTSYHAYQILYTEDLRRNF